MQGIWIFILIVPSFCFAEICANGKEPSLVQQIDKSRHITLCGFEDHDYENASKGARAFSEFEVNYVKDKKAQKLFAAGEETHLVSTLAGNGLRLEEVWEVGDKFLPALAREVLCDEKDCKLTEPKCLLKAPANPFPNALADVQKKVDKRKWKDISEEAIDEVFAQALGGDSKAQKFLESKIPKGFEGAVSEAFMTDSARIKQAHSLKCL